MKDSKEKGSQLRQNKNVNNLTHFNKQGIRPTRTYRLNDSDDVESVDFSGEFRPIGGKTNCAVPGREDESLLGEGGTKTSSSPSASRREESEPFFEGPVSGDTITNGKTVCTFPKNSEKDDVISKQ